MKITDEQIEAAREHLKKLKSVPKEAKKHSKQQAVIALKTQIKEAQKKGYGYKQIAEMLMEFQIEISEGTLKSYLKRAKGGKQQTAAQKKAITDGDDKKA